MKPTILLADNDLDYLAITQEFLENHGFQVVGVSNVLDAHRALLNDHPRIQVAVLDVRLMSNDDERDTSGIDLAKLHLVPAVIVTTYPSLSYAVEALRVFNGRSPAVDFVDKRDSLDILLQAINKTLPHRDTMLEILRKAFNETELRTLCFRLQIEYDDLIGNTHHDKARELLLTIERQGRFYRLVELCRKERPNLV